MMTSSSEHWHRENKPLTDENSLALPVTWQWAPDPEKKGRELQWFAQDMDSSEWQGVATTTHLEKQGHTDYGLAWFRTQFRLPADPAGQTIVLRLGAVDETCWVWINGREAGEYVYDAARDSMSWKRPLFFDITRHVRAGEQNQVTVLVQNVSGLGGIWKPCHIVFEP